MPPGTVTVSVVRVAAVTVAAVPPEPPNLTVFDAGVAMKFVPVMMTDEPMFPPAGAKDVIVGAAACATPEKTRVVASASSTTPAFRTLIFLFVTLIPFARRFAKCAGMPSRRVESASNETT